MLAMSIQDLAAGRVHRIHKTMLQGTFHYQFSYLEDVFFNYSQHYVH